MPNPTTAVFVQVPAGKRGFFGILFTAVDFTALTTASSKHLLPQNITGPEGNQQLSSNPSDYQP